MIFLINFSEHGKGLEKPSNVKILTWEISSQEKPAKHIVCGGLGKLLLIISHSAGALHFFFFLFLIGIHSIQGLTTNKRNGVSRKIKHKKIKAYRKATKIID